MSDVEKAKRAADLYTFYEQIRLRHDFALSLKGTIKPELIEALGDDLFTLGFRSQAHPKKDDEGKIEEHIVFLALDSETKIFEEAEKQKLCRHFISFSKAEQAKINTLAMNYEIEKGLDKRVTYCESFEPITRKNRAQIARETVEADSQGKEVDDLYSTMSEADRVRLSYQILTRVKWSELKKTN